MNGTMENVKLEVQRGDIVLVNLGEGYGSEQGGNCRPVIVISNFLCNMYSPTITVMIVSSQMHKYGKLTTHVLLPVECGLNRESFAMGEQVMTIDKSRIIKKVAKLNEEKMEEINFVVQIQMGLIPIPPKNQIKSFQYQTAK